MAADPKTPLGSMDWDAFRQQLVDYVQLELAGQDADARYPDIGFLVETVPACAAAYDREFRMQGRRMPVEELRRLGDRGAVAEVMDRILRTASPATIPPPLPDWIETAVEHGRVWLDGQTRRWRQVLISLADVTLSDNSLPAPTGMLGPGSEGEEIRTQIILAPDDADVQVTIALQADSDAASECTVDVAVALYDRLGDFSGVEIALMHQGETRSQVTDALGKVRFTGLGCDQLQDMSVRVVFPGK